jgi:hypothetical protein
MAIIERKRRKQRHDMKVPAPGTKQIIKVYIDINPGPASPAQKAAWHKFWAKLISEAKGEQ